MTITLTELQRIPTSGARAVEPFSVAGNDLLAIPQLALDVPGTAAGMNAGNSDTEVLLLQLVDGRYHPFSTLPGPGGEDAEFFAIGERCFLAVASIRSGAGPYDYSIGSQIFEWSGAGFVEFQAVPSFAAKQWRHWTVEGRHFLGLAQGVDLPHIEGPNRDSVIFEWDGDRFVEFQTVPSTWGYNWHPFVVDGAHLLAHADHTGPSRLYRWDGNRYVDVQTLIDRGGRAFADFTASGTHHLLVAGIDTQPVLMAWNAGRFEAVQSLEGLGARELLVVEHSGRLLVIRVNFIHGSPADPDPVLTSQVYEWQDGELRVVAEFPTSGGTDVAVVTRPLQQPEHSGHSGPEDLRFVVSNSLSPGVRFATDTVLYALATTETAR